MFDKTNDDAKKNPSNVIATNLPQFADSLKVIERYAFVHGDAPFVSHTPVVGPLIVFAKNLLRRVLRWALPLAFGSQDEFNAAVADVLVEFTQRAALAPGEIPSAVNLDAVLNQLDASNPRDRALIIALQMLAREISLLHESVRAANLSAAETERALVELEKDVDKLKS